MENKTLAVRLVFTEEHFEMAYMMLERQFKEKTPPREFFLEGKVTDLQLSQLDEVNGHSTCQYMMAAKIAFYAGEIAAEQHKNKSSIIGLDGKHLDNG